MSEETLEPDRVAGAPHPRRTDRLFGQDAAERAFLEACRSGRLHHAWLLSGPRGVGKATLAWRIARYLLAGRSEGTSLDVAPEDPVARRVAALSEPGLALLRRGWDGERKRYKATITVDEVRQLKSFFALSPGAGSYRVAIVDTADELTPNAANALLKLLEEPPAGAVLLLVSHRPVRLLPTIRSRCRELRLKPLGSGDMTAALSAAGLETGGEGAALATLAGGSVGEALRLAGAEGLAVYREAVALLSEAPGMDRARARAFAERAARQGEDAAFDTVARALDLLLARLAQTGATGALEPEAAPGERETLVRLAPDLRAAQGWADLAQRLGDRVRQAHAVNLDPAALILDTVMRIDAQAGAREGADTGT